MSTFNTIAGAAGVANLFGTAAAELFDLVVRPKRGFEYTGSDGQLVSIVAQATIEEKHQDELTITEHPVEQGAAITDHAYKQPAVVTLNLGWSNSDFGAGFDSGYINSIYGKLLKIQEDRILVDLFTGKRLYTNMLIQSLATFTDAKTSYALPITMTCKQVLVVQSVPTTVTSDQSLQQSPADTTPVGNTGTHELQTAPFFDDGFIDGTPTEVAP